MSAGQALTLAALLIDFELEDAHARPDTIRYPAAWVRELEAARAALDRLKANLHTYGVITSWTEANGHNL